VCGDRAHEVHICNMGVLTTTNATRWVHRSRFSVKDCSVITPLVLLVSFHSRSDARAGAARGPPPPGEREARPAARGAWAEARGARGRRARGAGGRRDPACSFACGSERPLILHAAAQNARDARGRARECQVLKSWLVTITSERKPSHRAQCSTARAAQSTRQHHSSKQHQGTTSK
jgi:hypothetical protein